MMPMHEDALSRTAGVSPSVADTAGDERALARRARAGDEPAFAGLVERYGRPILSLCFASTLDRSTAEELAQDVFVAAWRGLPRFREDSEFSTWLFAIARNSCIDWSRRQAVRPRTTPIHEQAEPQASPSRTRDGADLLAAIAELSPPLRQALLLREIQGLSYDEIAVLQDVPLGTVRSRIAAARSSAAERLRR
jgi:RNA polymerase sigma-70 factor (ECF subfamily)